MAEIIMCFFFFYNTLSLNSIMYIGWAVLLLGFTMMVLPRVSLQKHGTAPEGKSWIHTTTLVDSGIYSIVRHPLYTGWMLDIVALMLISQHLYVVLTGIVPMLMVYYYTLGEDKSNRDKFGAAYVEYSEKVPMVNFIVGLARRAKRP